MRSSPSRRSCGSLSRPASSGCTRGCTPFRGGAAPAMARLPPCCSSQPRPAQAPCPPPLPPCSRRTTSCPSAARRPGSPRSLGAAHGAARASTPSPLSTCAYSATARARTSRCPPGFSANCCAWSSHGRGGRPRRCSLRCGRRRGAGSPPPPGRCGGGSRRTAAGCTRCSAAVEARPRRRRHGRGGRRAGSARVKGFEGLSPTCQSPSGTAPSRQRRSGRRRGGGRAAEVPAGCARAA
mmetsp:Transcript_29581/g.94657  ORF Transcript_29581/g.94657 Transcript_29581/m.94657 type:complete len:238 (-) Transcript_29581:250-963(-)